MFHAKKKKSTSSTSSENNVSNPATVPAEPAPVQPRPRLVFHCQQAHGSPTGVISDFTNVKELYQKIADAYDLEPQMILFCTLNTHKVDMTRLLGGQLGLEDFIFAHIRGQPKIVDIEKTEDALGLTITDNGAGLAFIKGIKEGSIIANIPGICVGDHIEKINNQSMIGSRHYEVAKILKEIPKGSTFSLRLVEPLKSGFSEIGGKSSGGNKKGGLGTGKATLRLKKGGTATVEEVMASLQTVTQESVCSQLTTINSAVSIADDSANIAIEKINALLESFLGISDAELAQTIWEVGNQKNNPSEFKIAIEESELREFAFTDALSFDLWGAISDAKQGRLKKKHNEFQMQL